MGDVPVHPRPDGGDDCATQTRSTPHNQASSAPETCPEESTPALRTRILDALLRPHALGTWRLAFSMAFAGIRIASVLLLLLLVWYVPSVFTSFAVVQLDQSDVVNLILSPSEELLLIFIVMRTHFGDDFDDQLFDSTWTCLSRRLSAPLLPWSGTVDLLVPDQG